MTLGFLLEKSLTMTKSPFTPKELEEFEELLLAKKSDLLKEINDQAEEVGQDFDKQGDLVDMATDLLEKEMNLSLTETERAALVAIDNALERIKNKTFGICVDSGEVINKTRLKAVPEAKRTVAAQEKFDKMMKDKKLKSGSYAKQYST